MLCDGIPLFQLPQFLHLVHCLERAQVVRLTALRDMVMNKGMVRLLAFSPATQVELQQSSHLASMSSGEAERLTEQQLVSQSLSEGAHMPTLETHPLSVATSIEGSNPVSYTVSVAPSVRKTDSCSFSLPYTPAGSNNLIHFP